MSLLKNIDADMLVMVPHKHEWLERLFKKSETKDMIFHARIPILIIPEKRLVDRYSLHREDQN